jgi:uncharacterized protein YbaA (DUF1428 family)
MTRTTNETYVDLYLLPVPQANLDAYRQQATIFGQVAKEHGALSYRELIGDDLAEGLAVEDGTAMTAAVAEFRSRAHRDEVMEAVLADPRVKALTERESPADMARMRYGGFAPFVTA